MCSQRKSSGYWCVQISEGPLYLNFLAHQSEDLCELFWSKFVCCHRCRRHKLFTFHLFLHNHWDNLIQQGQFHPNLVQSILDWRFKLAPCPFPKGDSKKIAKIHWGTLKKKFSRITGPISTKFKAFFNHSFAKMCLLIGTVSQVSDVALRPLV